jgi:uncharacterized protein DUF6174
MRIALALAGVLGALGVAPVSADLAEDLASARERWAEHGSEHYSFTISQYCYCAPADRGPIDVIVVDGQARPPTSMEPFKISSLRTTIHSLFDSIELALRRFPAANFHLELDPVDGHPIRFACDDPAIDDDQTTIIVVNFKHL